MAEPALTLRDHPQIIDLISVLEQSGLQKQKEEVQALVGYIDGMEEKLSQMMDEMKEMRLEVGKLHDKGIRARCSQLADTVEGKVRQTKVMVSTAKENLISSAKQMVQTFREKGRSALCHAAQALHIPSVLSRMGRGFAHSEKSMGQLAVRLDSMREELHQAGGHIKNAGLALTGKEPQESKELICLIGMIIGSCFGIFFSGEDSGTGQTMQTAVQEINTDYQENLDEIKTSHSYDVLEMSGSRAVWKEVLAVYAVKTTTDSDNAQEVATMDDEKLELLKDIFWQMNEISSSTSTQTETVIETSDDGNGNIVETETTVTQTYLYITVSHKTAEEMANQFGFNEDQREQMAELLADENNSLWSQVLYGITGRDGEIVTVALSQVGNVGGEPYWNWYGFGSRVEWCACFVSWCANECGYIEAGVIPKFAACASQGVPWFQERGLWQDNSYEPRPGDIIFFDWDDGGQDGSSDHVGIVEKVENGRVYTVEGNSGDSVRQNSYPVGYYEIYGYGTPAC